MKLKTHKFSLLEVVLVLVLMAIVMSVVIPTLYDDSAEERKLKMEDTLTKVFGNAAIRSRAFGLQVKLTFVTDGESSITCTLVNEETNPELPVVASEDESEDQYRTRLQNNINNEIWGGEDEYELPTGISVMNFEDLANDKDEIIFRFFPGGEAVGPKEAMLLAIDELEFTVNVDRLMGQLIVRKIEEL